jgi:hypothetical protein
MERSDGIPVVRLYGATIGIVSGVYSGYLSVTGMSMSIGAWFMLALGAVVLVHGIALLTPVADRIGTASGPLMLAYAVLMLLNQLRLETGATMDSSGGGMNGGMDGMSSGMATDPATGMAAMGADPGMVAIAVLMLASGLIMTVRTDGM